jgi:small ligand-binding sensory domain FIST
MHWSSAVSTKSQLEDAVLEAGSTVRTEMQQREIDLLLVFISHHFSRQYGDLPRLLRRHLPHRHLLGCSAGGVIGGGHEVEGRAALSITAAHLPGVALAPFRLGPGSLPDDDASPRAWATCAGVPVDPISHFLLIADPFSCPTPQLIAGLDYAYPASVKIGGLASGARRAGENMLYSDDVLERSGMVGVAMQGDITISTIVAQGCRPVGEPLRLTRAQGPLLAEMENHPALDILQNVLGGLSARDRELARQALFLGIGPSESTAPPRPGDYLIRNIVGADTDSGALVVGESLRSGQIVRFHIRDAAASADDLELMLDRFATDEARRGARGALLFACLGRGIGLYGRPDHDTDAFRSHLGQVPLGGFFCNGEIGPVRGSTRLHGYTSAFGIFGPGLG